MPYIKSVPVHVTVKRSLAYILDTSKTEGNFVTSRNCLADPNDAYRMMKLVYEQFSGKKFDSPLPEKGKARVKAIHYLLSFDPTDNVSPAKAMAIAKTLVRENFGLDCQVVIAVHTDKEHTHVHFIINSYDITGKKFYDNQTTLWQLRNRSDEVCKRYGIQPYDKSKGRGKTLAYNEWQHRKDKTSWKQQIAEKIDELIPQVQSVDDLIETLIALGYEIKRGKYISIRAPGQERFVRTKTLGDDYTEESLATRIRFNYVEGGFSIARYDTNDLYRAYAEATDGVYQLNETPADELQRLSAILCVLNENDINSIGEVESKLQRIPQELERLQKEIDNISYVQEMREGIIYHAEQYFKYKDIQDPTDYEMQMLETYRGSMDNNDIHTEDDVEKFRGDYDRYEKYLSELADRKQSLLNRQIVYADILATYADISKGDYVSNLVERVRKRREEAERSKETQNRNPTKKKFRR